MTSRTYASSARSEALCPPLNALRLALALPDDNGPVRGVLTTRIFPKLKAAFQTRQIKPGVGGFCDRMDKRLEAKLSDGHQRQDRLEGHFVPLYWLLRLIFPYSSID